MDANVNVTFSSLTDSFNLIAAVYTPAIQSHLYYLLRMRWIILASACTSLLIIQETRTTTLNKILKLESKRSRRGIQSYNYTEHLTESVPPLYLLFRWMTLQHATKHGFRIKPQMALWKRSRVAGDACAARRQVGSLYWEAWEVFKTLCVQTKAVQVRRREKQHSETEASVLGGPTYCNVTVTLHNFS